MATQEEILEARLPLPLLPAAPVRPVRLMRPKKRANLTSFWFLSMKRRKSMSSKSSARSADWVSKKRKTLLKPAAKPLKRAFPKRMRPLLKRSWKKPEPKSRSNKFLLFRPSGRKVFPDKELKVSFYQSTKRQSVSLFPCKAEADCLFI